MFDWLKRLFGWKPKPVPTEPEPRYFSVTVRYPDSSGVFGARVQLNEFVAFTDDAARVRIGPLHKDTHHFDLHIEPPDAGFEPYELRDFDIAGSGEWPDIYLEPAAYMLPRLQVRGGAANGLAFANVFRLETGEYFTAIECSDFNLLARYVNGDDIEPILEQRADIGFNMLRVWTLMDLAQFGIGKLMLEEHPEVYDKIPGFLNLCAKYGLYVEFTAYTGINDPDHWRRLCDACVSSTNVILELVNELDQNTNEPDHLGRVFDLAFGNYPAPCLASHGSNGSQAHPVTPFWSYATFHTNNAPEEQRKIGHNAMEIGSVAVLTNETRRCPSSYTSPDFAYDAAAGAALLCAGSCFHSVAGKMSGLFDGVELECAKAWAAGALSVPLRFQDGYYLHPAELEGPGILRAYMRVLPDAHFLVEIRS